LFESVSYDEATVGQKSGAVKFVFFPLSPVSGEKVNLEGLLP